MTQFRISMHAVERFRERIVPSAGSEAAAREMMRVGLIGAAPLRRKTEVGDARWAVSEPHPFIAITKRDGCPRGWVEVVTVIPIEEHVQEFGDEEWIREVIDAAARDARAREPIAEQRSAASPSTATMASDLAELRTRAAILEQKLEAAQAHAKRRQASFEAEKVAYLANAERARVHCEAQAQARIEAARRLVERIREHAERNGAEASKARAALRVALLAVVAGEDPLPAVAAIDPGLASETFLYPERFTRRERVEAALRERAEGHR